MEDKITIPYSPDLDGISRIHDGKWGIVFAHGEYTKIEEGILASLSKKLAEKNISTIRFNFPFRMLKIKNKDPTILDQAFIHVYNWIVEQYPDIRWALGGHEIAAESAVRIASILDDGTNVPTIVGLSYPLFPLNRPELADPRPLAAILGEALFCQGSSSKRGDYQRMENSIQMMANHVEVMMIKGANHNLEIPGKEQDTIAFWIANDIERFLLHLD